MRLRHPRAHFAAAGLVAVLAISACGGATDVLQGRTPDQIITLAGSKVLAESYRMKLDSSFAVDASGVRGVPAAELTQIAAALGNAKVSGTGDVQNASRLRMAITFTVPTLASKGFVAVLYDGHYYISEDGGKRFADAGSFSLQGFSGSPTDIRTLLGGTTDVQDLGLSLHDGQHLEHLRATLGGNAITQMFERAQGSGTAATGLHQLATLFSQAVQLTHGVIDAYVRREDGRMESIHVTMTMSLDMGRLVAALLNGFGGRVPAGSGAQNISGPLVMSIDGTTTFSDYGAHITVKRPIVDPNAPGLPSLFGSGM